MSRVLIIHTVRTLVEYFDRKVREASPSTEVFHILDEALLEHIRARGHAAAEDTARLESHLAEGLAIGAKAALVTCSTLSRCVAQVRIPSRLPVLAIDDSLMDAIVRFQGSVIVLATNPTTVEPTRQSLVTRTLESGRASEVSIIVVDGAFAALQRGDLKAHDMIVAAAVTEHLRCYERVALAQASMARAIDQATEQERERVFSSPELAVGRLVTVLKDADAVSSIKPNLR